MDLRSNTYLPKAGDPDLMAWAIRRNLNRLRNGRRFVLPISIALAPHINYSAVDYRTYPSEDDLLRFSEWHLTVFVHDHGQLEITDAYLIGLVTIR